VKGGIKYEPLSSITSANGKLILISYWIGIGAKPVDKPREMHINPNI
jgi:hypothetical protein